MVEYSYVISNLELAQGELGEEGESKAATRVVIVYAATLKFSESFAFERTSVFTSVYHIDNYQHKLISCKFLCALG